MWILKAGPYFVDSAWWYASPCGPEYRSGVLPASIEIEENGYSALEGSIWQGKGERTEKEGRGCGSVEGDEALDRVAAPGGVQGPDGEEGSGEQVYVCSRQGEGGGRYGVRVEGVGEVGFVNHEGYFHARGLLSSRMLRLWNNREPL
jgi:hypothetical protein